MKCPRCGTFFCWLCLQQVDGGTFPAHFQWWNIKNGCANMQMQENVKVERGELIRAKILSIFQIIVLGLPSAALSFGCLIACLPCASAFGENWSSRFSGCMSMWGNFLTMLLVIPVFLVIAVTSPIWCCVYIFFESIKKRNASDDATSSEPEDKDLQVALRRSLADINISIPT